MAATGLRQGAVSLSIGTATVDSFVNRCLVKVSFLLSHTRLLYLPTLSFSTTPQTTKETEAQAAREDCSEE